MGSYAQIAASVIMGFAYGALPGLGGVFWYMGWKNRNETILKVGDVTVLTGLIALAVLVTGNWLFGWSSALASLMQ